MSSNFMADEPSHRGRTKLTLDACRRGNRTVEEASSSLGLADVQAAKLDIRRCTMRACEAHQDPYH